MTRRDFLRSVPKGAAVAAAVPVAAQALPEPKEPPTYDLKCIVEHIVIRQGDSWQVTTNDSGIHVFDCTWKNAT